MFETICKYKLVPSCWYSEEGLTAAENVFEKSIQLIQNENQETGTFLMINSIRGDDVYNDSVKYLDSKKEQYGRGLGLCKKALNLAIENKSCQAFEELLQHFIEAQTNILDVIAIDQHNNMFSEANITNIKERRDLLIKGIYQLLKTIQATQTMIFKKKLQMQDGKKTKTMFYM